MACREALVAAGVAVRDLRVRDKGDHASVEVDAALLAGPAAPGSPLEAALVDAVRRAGFDDARLDPRGFRSGSLNEALVREPVGKPLEPGS